LPWFDRLVIENVAFNRSVHIRRPCIAGVPLCEPPTYRFPRIYYLHGGTVTEKMQKFMQSLGADVYRQLAEMAEERDVSVQELIRAVVIPDWLRLINKVRVETRGPKAPRPARDC